jgi:hypothetical protein
MHYMVDIGKDLPSGPSKITQIRAMIDKAQYFTINRGRQYGKTTTLSQLRRRLGDEYIIAQISFEGIGGSAFESEKAFTKAFMQLVQNGLKELDNFNDSAYIRRWNARCVNSILALSEHISRMCKKHKIVLMIDEVDSSTNYRVYIHFLGMLRDKYLKRNDGMDYTFHSVILAGVYDIKNIKLKMKMTGVYTPSPEEGGIYNSPWNIAVNFGVDMSFSAPEIATMLDEYEADNHTGMDIKAVSEELRNWTGGYPFLVSRLCQIIDTDLNKDWTIAGVENAAKKILQEKNTLFDDIIKNMEMYSDIYQLTYDILIVGKTKKDYIDNPVADRGLMFCFFRTESNNLVIANRIFENRLINYFNSKDDFNAIGTKEVTGILKYDVVQDGKFDMELAIRKFAQHYSQIFTERDTDFLERNGRMVFLSYLLPLINGEGFYHLESQFTDLRRMDIVVDYGNDQFIIELKLWRGEAYEEQGYKQLTDYLHDKQIDTGWLVCFDLRKDKQTRMGWLEKNGCKIFEAVV